MQTTLSQISLPIAISLIFLGIVIIVLVVILIRRRQAANQAPPTPEIPPATTIDYTAIPLEEPESWQDRLRNLSLAARVLLLLIPILLCLSIGVLALSLINEEQSVAPPPTPTPSPIPVTLTIEDATVVRAEPPTINVRVRATGLPDNTELQVELRADGQPLRWFDPDQTIRIRRDRGDLRAEKLPDGDPTPQGPRYTVVVRLPDGSLSDEAELLIPELVAAAFFGTVAEVPTPTFPPTFTPEPVAQVTPTPPPTPTIPPTPVLPVGQPVAVINGGNVRKLPFITDNVIGGVNAGEQVQILARTPNARWFYVRTVRDEIGWVSGTLLAVNDLIIAEARVANVVTVFVSGTVYLAADPDSAAIDRVEANEVVELLERTADGSWYRVLNVRDREGWVQASLLGIPDDVIAQVPIAQ
ncbi:SH3 domain-containing protein [Chloroflexus sp.]|uniref:SH3 domain-containing protein n=1 Tax=Chloroflexus sp. TaxID=1904827 RepID=UPI0026398070|nr:SH3 domain-containing protein [uncultured Chloroflexus sp.]